MKADLHEAHTQVLEGVDNIRTIAKDAERVSLVAKNANIIIQDIDRQFEQATKLTKIDIAFLFLAVALQVARQYFFTNFKERSGHTESFMANPKAIPGGNTTAVPGYPKPSYALCAPRIPLPKFPICK
jgi:hypothetical protein